MTRDSVLDAFARNQAAHNVVVTRLAGGRVDADDDAVCCDAANPVPFFNQTVLLRPADDALLARVDAFHAGGGGATLLSPWPTPDLSDRGWHLMGHPMFVVRAPGSVDHTPPADVEVRRVESLDDLGTFERVMADGYPMPAAQGLPPGSVYPEAALDDGVVLRLGLLDGEPVAAGAVYVDDGVVNLCAAATLPAARRRGVWESLVWARVADAPDRPAVAYTSDDSRPGFVRMGFLPLLRFTLWFRPA